MPADTAPPYPSSAWSGKSIPKAAGSNVSVPPGETSLSAARAKSNEWASAPSSLHPHSDGAPAGPRRLLTLPLCLLLFALLLALLLLILLAVLFGQLGALRADLNSQSTALGALKAQLGKAPDTVAKRHSTESTAPAANSKVRRPHRRGGFRGGTTCLGLSNPANPLGASVQTSTCGGGAGNSGVPVLNRVAGRVEPMSLEDADADVGGWLEVSNASGWDGVDGVYEEEELWDRDSRRRPFERPTEDAARATAKSGNPTVMATVEKAAFTAKAGTNSTTNAKNTTTTGANATQVGLGYASQVLLTNATSTNATADPSEFCPTTETAVGTLLVIRPCPPRYVYIFKHNDDYALRFNVGGTDAWTGCYELNWGEGGGRAEFLRCRGDGKPRLSALWKAVKEN
ncbi:hypothetical protein HDU96_010948 [Phlyctochytrium bullatum]|nr:hypothetical protein HDU96_010948 [Phlyctochytrium bullatum]